MDEIINIENIKIHLFKNELLMNKKEYQPFLDKLTNYKYIKKCDDLKLGRYIRWIPLIDPDIFNLTVGGFICGIHCNETNTKILCKNYKNDLFNCIFDSSLVFQKLSKQETMIKDILSDLLVGSI